MFTYLIACDTSYQNREHEISIQLDCFVVKDYFDSNCEDRPAITLVVWGHVHVPSLVVRMASDLYIIL